MITQSELEELAEKYETKDFIKDDPIQFPHRFILPRHCEGVNVSACSDKECSNLYGTKPPPKQSPSHLYDIEIAAFISSLIAFGSRKAFIQKLDDLFKIMDNQPYNFVINFNPDKLKGFKYRIFKDTDIIEVFYILNKLYTQDGGLKKLFEYGYNAPHPNPPPLVGREKKPILTMLQVVVDYFYSNVQNKVGRGFYNMIPNPKNGGTMKKMNLFLRWMVRKPPVDLGIWDFIPTEKLLIPFDTHVSKLSREMGLLTRKIDDFKAVLELTENLKKIDPKDPTKFDFAIFGLGVNE